MCVTDQIHKVFESLFTGKSSLSSPKNSPWDVPRLLLVVCLFRQRHPTVLLLSCTSVCNLIVLSFFLSGPTLLYTGCHSLHKRIMRGMMKNAPSPFLSFVCFVPSFFPIFIMLESPLSLPEYVCVDIWLFLWDSFYRIVFQATAQ